MKKILTFGILALFSLPAHAIDNDALLEGAKLCTHHMPRYEREYGIPTHLLGAIATTETGRFHDGLSLSVPWPWTINAEGKGYFYDTKEQAIAAARRMQAQGIQSMDVGCMQVNLYHHAKAFSSLDEAFDPQKNVAYAAGFLRNLYQETGSWKTASASYHSKTPQRGSQYVGLVYDRWQKIIEKLRVAKQQVPETTVVAMNTLNDPKIPVAPVAPAPRVVSTKPMLSQNAAFKTPHMKSIQVRSVETASARDQGIIIVKPDIKVVDDAPLQTAALAPAAAAPDNAKIIRLDNSRVVQTPLGQQRTMPNFIFAD